MGTARLTPGQCDNASTSRLRSCALVTFLVCLGAALPAGPAVAAGQWRPLARQHTDADTLYVFDARRERRLIPGAGGLIAAAPGRGQPTWGAGARVRVVRGRYRAGIESIARDRGYLWMPSVGLIAPREFTVEMWLRCARSWADVADQTPFRIGDANDAVDLRLTVDGGRLTASLRHLQSARGPVQASIPVSAAGLRANRWVNVALTFRRGTLRLYLNGRIAGARRGIVAPAVWSDSGNGDGLDLLGAEGKGATDFSLSDLRISRVARVPGRRARRASRSTLTVGGASGRRIRMGLLGALHGFGQVGARTERIARSGIRVVRTDKFLTATPIKAGPPDADHPSAGRSGRFSYDWQVVDRTMRYLRRLRVTPYISIDATPQILGGSVAPFKGEALRTLRSNASAFAPEVPSDLGAFAAMAGDLVHHVLKEKRFRVRYWGVWNEPDLDVFWKGGLDGYLRLYDSVAAAVKGVDPALKVGGPETVGWDAAWLEGVIRHAAQQHVPLDFLSWHMYDSTAVEIAQVRAQADRWARRYGLGHRLRLINGEWSWQLANAPGGRRPFKTRNYFRNDWGAAFAAASLVEMQRAGVVYGIYGKAVGDPGAKGLAGGALLAPTFPWAGLNVFRMWARLAPRVARTTFSGVPGVFSIASRGDGRTTVLLSYLRYRRGRSVPVTVRVRGAKRGARVTHFVVDAHHSNRQDAGAAHTTLETVRSLRVGAGGRVTVRVRPRSVHLLVIGRR
jgi:Glycosyl hydrolases family 39/Concanavalin A-like lectin/glucanases superfamily